MPWRPSPPKIQGCRIDQHIQRWLKYQLQDSIANKEMAWPSRHARTIRHNIEIFQVILSNFTMAHKGLAAKKKQSLQRKKVNVAIKKHAANKKMNVEKKMLQTKK